MRRSIQISLLAGAFSVGLIATPAASFADVHDDFRRASNARRCKLAPYSSPRSNCKSAFKRAKDRENKIDCSKLGTLGLKTVLKTTKILLAAENKNKNKNSSRIASLKRQIQKLERDIRKRVDKARKRYSRAGRVANNFKKARNVMGSNLSRRINGDVRKAQNKAKREKDKSRHAKLTARAARMAGFSAVITGKASGFRANLQARRAAALGAQKLCGKARDGRF